MQFTAPKFSTEVKTFRDASDVLMSLLHAQNQTYNTCIMPSFHHGNDMVEAVIKMLDTVESPDGLDHIVVLAHSTVYYRIRKECRSVLEMENHDPRVGYSGTLLGHRFFAHPRLRRNTIVVGGKKGKAVRFIVGAETDWNPNQPLVV